LQRPPFLRGVTAHAAVDLERLDLGEPLWLGDPGERLLRRRHGAGMSGFHTEIHERDQPPERSLPLRVRMAIAGSRELGDDRVTHER
jgi:hypothetical protein